MFIPSVVDTLVTAGEIAVKVLQSPSNIILRGPCLMHNHLHIIIREWAF